LRAMKKAYISFGRGHVHSVAGKTFDEDCLALVKGEDMNDCRSQAFRLFGREWFTSYEHSDLQAADFMKYFPRGVIDAMPGAYKDE